MGTAVLLRVALLIAGITWLFAFVLEWSDGPTLTPGLLYHWSMEHGVLSTFAIVAALAPAWLGQQIAARSRRARILRLGLVVAGVTWGIGVPPALVGVGLGGTVNEWMGFVGLPSEWGAVAPDAPLGAALYFHWAFQHLLLAGFALAAAAAPAPVFSVVGAGEPSAESLDLASLDALRRPVVAAEGRP